MTLHNSNPENHGPSGDVIETALVRDVKSVLNDLALALASGVAVLKIEEGRDATVLHLTPTKPSAARLSVTIPHEEAGDLTLIAGKGTIFEIPSRGKRYTELPRIEELKKICWSVIENGLTETVLLNEGELVKGEGTVLLPEPMTVRWSRATLSSLFRKPTETIRYAGFF